MSTIQPTAVTEGSGREQRAPLVVRGLHLLLLAGACLYPLCFLLVASKRIGYPFELEWMEGGVVDMVRRVLAGQSLYVEPSLEFTPFMYTPLYFYLSAVASAVAGVGFVPLRAISLIAALGCMFVVGRMVQRETGSLYMGVLSACLLAATYEIGGAWYDIARVDALFMLLLLLSLYCLRFRPTLRGHGLAGVLLGLSFLTKQTALVVAVPLCVYCLIAERGLLRMVFPLAFAAVIGISTIVLDALSDGWYTFYVFQLPGQHSVAREMLTGFWIHDLGRTVGLALCFAVFFVIQLAMQRKYRSFLFYGAVLVALVGAAWGSRLHAASYRNVAMPAYVAVSMLFGMGLHEIFEALRNARAANSLSPLRVCVLLFALCQFGVLYYDPRELVPSPQDERAGHAFLEQLRGIEGEVLVPYHGYLPSLAGKGTWAQAMALEDIFSGQSETLQLKLRREIEQAIASGRFSAIVIDHGWFMEQINADYLDQGPVFEKKKVFYPVTGWRVRPTRLYVRKQEPGSLDAHGQQGQY